VATSRLPKQLTAKQQRFVDEYLVDINATQAAIRAGYSPRTADSMASQLLAHPAVGPAVRAALEARSQRTKITQDEVIERLAMIARMDPRKLYRPDGTFKAVHELDDETALAVASVEFTEQGGKKVRFWDKKGALELLGKHLGMFVERVEHSGKVESAVTVYLPANGR
jgi:phage terminase small subunit